ncbi:hypothetical protein VFC49_06935 [Thermococcus sp. SY098]|uniref:hypothetical protein n=1 Tax=Thermococcus sp. SY098 TaxID=3111325 RepID=UPI002D792AFE|nr:hypothetical protein [Thermococcus sp. SY098]WRS51820.1 hypothetical protein VFC49_06935 [Thermococcus sp. SY098]
MSLETEKAFWAFVAQERAQARVVKEEPTTLEEWLEQEIEKALETKARLEREAAVLKAKKQKAELEKVEKDIEYWNGYLDALEDVKRMLREVFA